LSERFAAHERNETAWKSSRKS